MPSKGVPTAIIVMSVSRTRPGSRSSREALADVAREQLLEPLLEDRRLARSMTVDLLLIDVDADHLVALLGEADARDEPDVADAHDRDPHQASAASRLPAYQIIERLRPSSSQTCGS